MPITEKIGNCFVLQTGYLRQNAIAGAGLFTVCKRNLEESANLEVSPSKVLLIEFLSKHPTGVPGPLGSSLAPLPKAGGQSILRAKGQRHDIIPKAKGSNTG